MSCKLTGNAPRIFDVTRPSHPVKWTMTVDVGLQNGVAMASLGGDAVTSETLDEKLLVFPIVKLFDHFQDRGRVLAIEPGGPSVDPKGQ